MVKYLHFCHLFLTNYSGGTGLPLHRDPPRARANPGGGVLPVLSKLPSSAINRQVIAAARVHWGRGERDRSRDRIARVSCGDYLYQRCTSWTTFYTRGTTHFEICCMKIHIEDKLLYLWCNYLFGISTS
jgi:hypothetical protein